MEESEAHADTGKPSTLNKVTASHKATMMVISSSGVKLAQPETTGPTLTTMGNENPLGSQQSTFEHAERRPESNSVLNLAAVIDNSKEVNSSIF